MKADSNFKHVVVHGVSPPQAQDLSFAFAFAELHIVPARPFLQLAEMPLDGDAALERTDCFPAFYVICRPAEDVLYPVMPIINEAVLYSIGAQKLAANRTLSSW